MKRFIILLTALVLMLSACAETFPAFPLEGVKIGIDPGHQEKANSSREPVAPGSAETKAKTAGGTRGAATGTPEYVLTLEVSLKLREILEELGAEVLMTRETHDVDLSNIERAVMMNEWGADLVLRIHADGSVDKNVHGTGMYVRKTGTCAAESAELAFCLLDCVCARTGSYKKGVYRRDTYTGLNWSEVPCVLVEMGYMTNYEENIKLEDSAYQDEIVRGLAEGIILWVNKGAEE